MEEIMTSERIKARITSLEYSARQKTDQGRSLVEIGIERWGPLPADLKADLAALDKRVSQRPPHFVISEQGDLDIANRLARWLACGDQWRA